MERVPEENPAVSVETTPSAPEASAPEATADSPDSGAESAVVPEAAKVSAPTDTTAKDTHEPKEPVAAEAVPAAEKPAAAAADASPADKPADTAADASPAEKPAAAAADEKPTDPAAMASLLGDAAAAPTPKAGTRIHGKIVKLGEDSAFVDFGGREEATLDLKEIRDPEGKLTRKVGDEIQGTITSVKGGIKISVRSGRSVPKNLPMLIEAARTGVPIEGKVTSVNKGGLVVHIMGVRGFCPFSQVDRHYVEDPAVFVGKKLTFKVASADEKGRNVVLSRRVLLEEEAKSNSAELRTTLEVGKVVKGVVARIRPFGAFVDLGGIDGLLHVSEISHGRVTDPSKALQLGQEIEVKVRSVENLGTKDERIGLSLKDLQEDPWEAVASGLTSGQKIKAKVVRLAPFGAFLEIAPGVDGLAHVSTLAEGHVGQPADVVKVGDEVEPWVLSVDRESRRISLSLMEPGEMPDPSERRGGARPRRDDRRPSRDSGPREHKSSPEGVTGMTSMQEAFERLKSRMDQ
ncbi:MAG: hypothetical protein DHS20C21_08040 [Gemmatimonadota bacterium]|nr:MAG: hypothetical protein DHS20C21_08040 [Gemmatimonadota bacterium]